MEMVFNKNVDQKQIEEFENDTLDRVSNLPMFVYLKNELIRKKLFFTIEVQHSNLDLNRYYSELVINIFNERGDMLCEYDEPNCTIMLCETLCFMRRGRIIGIDLLTDKEFLESLESLIREIKKYSRDI